MATTLRQKKLLAAEDFTALYESFANANFKAYDYDTIRTAMVDYLLMMTEIIMIGLKAVNLLH